MTTRRGFVAYAAAVALGLALPAQAKPKSQLQLAEVDFPQPSARFKGREKQIKSTIRRHALASAKHLDFGDKPLVVTLVIRDLSAAETDGVFTLACTLIGRIKGAGSARSKIAFGGKPEKRRKVESQVLASVTDGVMIRLAELTRQR